MSIPNTSFFATPAAYVWSQGPSLQHQLDQIEISHLLQQVHIKLAAHSSDQLAPILSYVSDPKVFLGVVLATCHHNLPEVTRLLTQVAPSNPLVCVREIYNLYFGSIISTIQQWVASFPGNPDRELLYMMEISRLLAHDLIDDTGAVNRGLVQFLKNKMPIQFAPSLPDLYKKQFDIVMNLLETDPTFNQLLFETGPPCSFLCDDILMTLRDPHLRREELTSTHSKRALLGALLSYHRQDPLNTDCFIQSLIIGFLQHNPTLILRYLKEYISTGIFTTPHPITGTWRDTFHCSYETAAMTRAEILSSPFFSLLIPPGLPPLVHPQPLSLSSPLEEIRRMTISYFPREAQTAEAQQFLRLRLNRLASYFLHPLLLRLANHAKVIGDNFTVHRPKLFREWERLFIDFPQLLPLKDAFFSYLNQRMLIRRIDDEPFLQNLMSLNASRERVLCQGGQLCHFDPIQTNWFGIKTVEQLRDTLLGVLQTAQIHSRLPAFEFTNVFTQLQHPSFLVWLKNAAVSAAGGSNSYPQEIYESPYCYLSIEGGDPYGIAREFFGITFKLYSLVGEKPSETLLSLATCFRHGLNRRDPHPLVIGIHYLSDSSSPGHAYTISPYNSTLRQFWDIPNPRGKMEAMISEIERRGKTPLSEAQKNFLTTVINRKFSQDPQKIIAAIPAISEAGISPESFVQNWRQNLPLKDFPRLQTALNEAVELLPWEFWQNEAPRIASSLSSAHFPPQVYLPEVIDRLLTGIAHAQQETISEASLPFGMTIQRGAYVIHKTLQSLGFSLEYGQLLAPLCERYGFPPRFQFGDMNFSDSSIKELWVVPNYGNQETPLRYIHSNGKGQFEKKWLLPFRNHFVHILEKPIF